MGNTVTKAHDDYDDYVTLCKFLDIDYLRFHDYEPISFYDHLKEILEEEGVSTIEQVYQKVK